MQLLYIHKSVRFLHFYKLGAVIVLQLCENHPAKNFRLPRCMYRYIIYSMQQAPMDSPGDT